MPQSTGDSHVAAEATHCLHSQQRTTSLPLLAWSQGHEVGLFLQTLYTCCPVASSPHLCHHTAHHPCQGSHLLKVTWPLSPSPPPSCVLKATTMPPQLLPVAHHFEHSLATHPSFRSFPPSPTCGFCFVLVWFRDRASSILGWFQSHHFSQG